MNYGLGVAGDARADLRAMDPWLQEEFWDELERLAANPSLIPVPSASGDILFKFQRATADIKHYITPTVSRNDLGRTITVLGIRHRQRGRRR